MRSQIKARAFTLVEILIVLAIIAVLAALFVGVSGRVKANARRAACASNLRQLGMAAAMYCQDSDEVYMPSVQKEGTPVFWRTLLMPYINNPDILQCPDDETKTATTYANATSYGYNAHVGGVAFPQENSPHFDPNQKSLAQIVRPSATVLMTDSGTIPIAGAAPENWPPSIPCPPEIGDSAVLSNHVSSNEGETVVQNSLLAAPLARHAGQTNVLWCDGHVTTQTVASFYVAPGTTAKGETVPGYAPCFRPEKGCEP